MSEPDSSKLKNENIPGFLNCHFWGSKQRTRCAECLSVCLSVNCLSVCLWTVICTNRSSDYCQIQCKIYLQNLSSSLSFVRMGSLSPELRLKSQLYLEPYFLPFLPLLPIFLGRCGWRLAQKILHPVHLSWCDSSQKRCSTRQLQLRSQWNVASALYISHRTTQTTSKETPTNFTEGMWIF